MYYYKLDSILDDDLILKIKVIRSNKRFRQIISITGPNIEGLSNPQMTSEDRDCISTCS